MYGYILCMTLSQRKHFLFGRMLSQGLSLSNVQFVCVHANPSCAFLLCFSLVGIQ